MGWKLILLKKYYNGGLGPPPVAPTGTGGSMTKYKQLTLDDRLLIEAGLKEGNSFRGIGERIGKDLFHRLERGPLSPGL